MRRRHAALLAYGILLTASHIKVGHEKKSIPAGMRVAHVGSIDIAYRDTRPESRERPVVLVHGSPGSAEVFDELADLLAPHFRVIVPDLPGFGASTHDIPDYSFRAHATYLLALMDSLHVDKADLVGFSMGGGVVLSVFDAAPERVGSIVMLSAIGVQEEELTGSYPLNHAIHGAQLAALWAGKYLFPHFGLFRGMPFTIEYARNFYDSDQRPLRSTLSRYRGPMLILHGRRDKNVPIAAAREHHRLVPQSKLIEYDTDHFMTFLHPSIFAEALAQFLRTTLTAEVAHLVDNHVRGLAGVATREYGDTAGCGHYRSI